jgi:calcium-translocating P-type ATPase
MARRNVLVRHLPAVETLGTATVICTDKTGTLTENRLEVGRLWAAGRFVDCRDTAQVASAARAHPRLFEVAAQCHGARSRRSGHGDREWLGDPLERALIAFATRGLGEGWDSWEKRGELPFDSARRRMTTVHRVDGGTLTLMKGAPESVLPACTAIEAEDGVQPLSADRVKSVLEAQEQTAASGFRVLAMAWRLDSAGVVPRAGEERDAEAALEQGLILSGFVGLVDPPRDGVAEAVRRCREAGIRVIMVTGDHPRTAIWVARSIGLVRSQSPRVILGDELGRMSDVQLQLELGGPEIVFARVAADQKMRIVCALKRKGEVVAVTGDGVNDAPALRKADIGISMGISGTDVARESSDIILLDDNFAAIVAGIEEGRAVYANIRKFLTYILTSNVPELVPYLAFVLLRMPLALTVIQILAIDLGTDMVPALALGAEPPSPGTLQVPPRAQAERLMDVGLVVRAYLWLGLMQAAGCLWVFLGTLHDGGWQAGVVLGPADPLYRLATTACLATVVVMQVVNLMCCRSPTQTAFASGLGGNWLLPVGVAVEVMLLLGIVYTPWGNALFGTAALPPGAWLRMAPPAVAMLLLEELRKWLAGRWRRAARSW